MKRIRRSFSNVMRFEVFLKQQNVRVELLRAKMDHTQRSTFELVLNLIVAYNELTLRPLEINEPSYHQWILSVFKKRGETILSRPSFEPGSPQTLCATILQDPVWFVLDQELGREMIQFLVYDASLLLPQPKCPGTSIQLTGKPLPYRGTTDNANAQSSTGTGSQLFITKTPPLSEEQKLAAKRGDRIPRKPPMAVDAITNLQFIIPTVFGNHFPAAKTDLLPEIDEVPRCLLPLHFILLQVKSRLLSGNLDNQFRKIRGDKGHLVPKHIVAKFCLQSLQYLLPQDTFGPLSNWKLLADKIAQYVKLNRFAKFYISNMTEGFKITETWVGKASSKQQAQRNQMIFKQFMFWIFTFVNEYLMSRFVLRPTNAGNDAYLKVNGWKAALRDQRKNFVKTLVPIDNPTDSQKYLASKTYLVPKPKPGSFRTIVNLKRHKTTLASANQVLNHHSNIASETSNMKSSREAFPLIHKYLSDHEGARFYAVRTDIQGCFDAANSDTVLSLVRNLVAPSSTYAKRLLAPVYSPWDRPAEVVSPLAQNITPLSSSMVPVRSTNQIFTEQSSKTTLVTGRHVVTKVDNILNRLLVRVGEEIYYKTSGIPQGSSVSTALCNILCQDFIRNELSRVWSLPHALLLRYVDDFLFISTDLKDAEYFLKTINRPGGFPHYGISFSAEKTETNFGSCSSPDTKFLGIPISLRSNRITMTPSLELDSLYQAISSTYKHKQVIMSPSERLDRCINPIMVNYVPLDLTSYLKTKTRTMRDYAWVDIENVILQKASKLAVVFRTFHKLGNEPPARLVSQVVRLAVRSICRLLLALEIDFKDSRKILYGFLRYLLKSGRLRMKGTLRYGIGIWVSLYKTHATQQPKKTKYGMMSECHKF